MVNIIGKELLEEVGLDIAVYGDDVVIGRRADGFPFGIGDIVVKNNSECSIICRYCGVDEDGAILTDSFHILRSNGDIECKRRRFSGIGLGYVKNYRLADENQKENFLDAIKDAPYITY